MVTGTIRIQLTGSGSIPSQVVTRIPKRSKTTRSAYNFNLVMMSTIKIYEYHYMPLAATVNKRATLAVALCGITHFF